MTPEGLQPTSKAGYNGWRICGELTPTCQKVPVSDQLSQSGEPAISACYTALI